MANGGFYNKEKLKPVFVFIIFVENIGSRVDMHTHAGNGRSSTRH